jgi:O-acetyl-ADP-ribose deacetylase (regulator of RNase III)
MSAQLEVIVGRIETLDLDAIVNAANTSLVGGGGVDGAIRRAAGPELNALLAEKGRLPEGRALTTPGFRLPARWIIHTVAPVYHASSDEPRKTALLRSCYRECIAQALEQGCASIAFPALGTGAFGWPKKLGCRIAVESAREIETELRIVFCCFSGEDADIYRAEIA